MEKVRAERSKHMNLEKCLASGTSAQKVTGAGEKLLFGWLERDSVRRTRVQKWASTGAVIGPFRFQPACDSFD